MELSASDRHHLNAAEGWLDLDEPVEATTAAKGVRLSDRIEGKTGELSRLGI